MISVHKLSHFLLGIMIGLFMPNFSTIFYHPRRLEVPLSSRDVSQLKTNVKPHNESKEVRVICWVMTYPAKHNTSVRAVKETWAKRCPNLVFISNQNDSSLPAVAVDVPAGKEYLWGKTKRGFKYVYDHFLNDGDWFLKADDDTFVIMENLKLLLSQYDPNHPIHLGCHYNKKTPDGYMSGGAGYVLSKEALKRFVEVGLKDPTKCKQQDTGSEDSETGICLYKLGVRAADSRDAKGRHRFFPFTIDYYTHGHIYEYWFWENINDPFDEGENRWSTSPISWHYVKPKNMYILEYLIYHVWPYGRPLPLEDVQQIVPIQSGRENKTENSVTK